MNILDSFKLDGKRAVVTGGSGLYGRQIVQSLAMAGAEVYTASRNLEANESYAAKLRAEGLKVYAGRLDQGDETSIKAFLEGLTREGKTVTF